MTKERLYIIGVYTVMLLAPCTGVMIGGIITMLIIRI